ncbi:hypothetical protein [Sphingopyxis macrogoltabida]|uniref:Uncharacterized protein n=1 Tax=Sphingopyxis macrogoltabida TaxID=33050 RepID=A0AAC8Z268_SPHMC|nr:hypothetical protein [Sphingopyxis macrogoltabida]ALJ14268.1 hypothetical protein LH19_15465 [Sphingopyxis macrogoltabida]AMU90533.1 hypothetical protein ATM17_16035 [Sphingopyxis macrogoltabida]
MRSDDAALVGRARAVQAELRQHKSAIREHRSAAQAAAAELDKIRAECARRGIALTLVPGAAPVPGPGRAGPAGRA